MYTYIYECLSTHMYLYTDIYELLCIRQHLFMCINIYTSIHTFANCFGILMPGAHAHLYIYIYIYTHVHLRMYVCVHIHVQILVYCIYSYICTCLYTQIYAYGVATISRLLKIIGLFCKRALLKRLILQKRPRLLRSLLILATP